MATAFAIGRASSSSNRLRIEVSQYVPVDLTFQSLIGFYADDISDRDLSVDSEVINVPFHAFIASFVPSDSLFERNRPLSQRGASIEIVPLLYFG
jgi:hypothetical protein